MPIPDGIRVCPVGIRYVSREAGSTRAGRPVSIGNAADDALAKWGRRLDKAKRKAMRASLGGEAACRRAMKAWLEDGGQGCPIAAWSRCHPKGAKRDRARGFAEELRATLFALPSEEAREREWNRVRTDTSHVLHAEWEKYGTEDAPPEPARISCAELARRKAKKGKLRRLWDFDHEVAERMRSIRAGDTRPGELLLSLAKEWVRLGDLSGGLTERTPLRALDFVRLHRLALHHATRVALSRSRGPVVPPREVRRRASAAVARLRANGPKTAAQKKTSRRHLPSDAPGGRALG